MAPRKRRSRSSAPTIPTPESATNSIATSSPSSNRNSRSDDNEPEKPRTKRHLSDLPMSPDIDTPPSHQMHLHQHHHTNHHHHQHQSNHHHNHNHQLHNHQHQNQNKHSQSQTPSQSPSQGQSHQQRNPSRTSIPPSVPQDALTVISAATNAAQSTTGVASASTTATGTAADPSRFTVASVALHLYDQLMDWAVLQVAVQYKHHVFLAAEERRRAGAFSTTRQRSTPRVSIVSGSYGSSLKFSNQSVVVECSNCAVTMAAGRYAQHVGKCLGRGGRMSSRAASARSRASAEREKESSGDGDEARSRRRRHSSAAKTSTDQDSLPGLSSTGHTSHKRRKMSPVPNGGSASVGHSVLNSRGLPPSGRSRASPK